MNELIYHRFYFLQEKDREILEEKNPSGKVFSQWFFRKIAGKKKNRLEKTDKESILFKFRRNGFPLDFLLSANRTPW